MSQADSGECVSFPTDREGDKLVFSRRCLVYAVLLLIRVTLWRERHDGLRSKNLQVQT